MAAIAIPAQAPAAVYSLDYLPGDTGTMPAVNLVITTQDWLNGVGGYDIVGISGTVGSDAVTALKPNPSAPAYANDGRWIYNNVFFPASNPTLDTYGVVFQTAKSEYNLWGTGANAYTLGEWANGNYIYTSGQNFSQGKISLNTLAGVPEPVTWMFVISGLGVVSLALRHRRRFRARLGLNSLGLNSLGRWAPVG